MDIQSRKLGAIEYLIALKDERQMGLIESLISSMRDVDSASFQRLTHEDILARALRSEDDYANGRVTSQSALEQEMLVTQ